MGFFFLSIINLSKAFVFDKSVESPKTVMPDLIPAKKRDLRPASRRHRIYWIRVVSLSPE
jgi:hypothetical protein